MGSEPPKTAEMEFLDINLTKDSRLWLSAIHSPFCGGFYKKSYSALLWNAYKKIPKTRGRGPDKNLSRKRLEFTVCPETSVKNAVQEFHLWTVRGFFTYKFSKPEILHQVGCASTNPIHNIKLSLRNLYRHLSFFYNINNGYTFLFIFLLDRVWMRLLCLCC